MVRLKHAGILVVALACVSIPARLSAQALTLNVGPTLNGALGVNTFTLQASGGTAPYHYSITPGFAAPAGFRVQDGPPLPTNITVNPSGTGAFLGVATTSGTFMTSIRVTDAAATVLDKPITLNIPPLQFTINPPKMTLNVAYSYTFTGFGGSGGAGYSWTATNLPTGINLSPGGVLSGTPTAIPVGNAVVTLTDSTLSPPLNSLQRQVTITVDPFAITTPGLLPNATAFVFYSQTITAPGCPAPCSFTPTSFAGLTLNSAGVLSGTPFLQTGSFTVTATGAGPVSVSKQFTLFVTSPSTPLSSGFGGFGDQTFGNFVTASILPFGGTPPYTVSVVSGTLPNGISLVGPGDAVCNNCNPGLMYLSGRAMQLGTFNFTLNFMDSAGGSFTPAPYTWNISAISNSYFNLPLAGTTLAVGTPYTQPLLVFGGSNTYTFQAFTALPAGLSIDTNTGVISGTPTTGGNLTTQVRISEGGIVKLTVFIGFNVTGPPTVVTLPATNVTNTSARLNGTVNPSGFPTTGNFEWGATTAYGNTTSTMNFGSSFFTQTRFTDINITCVAGSVYHYRLVATNSQGARQGADQVFTCSPQVNTFNANDITAASARLNGSVNPNGLPSTTSFQWGTTTSLGNQTPIQPVGSGTSFVSTSAVISGLTCGTLYHFRAVGGNANGLSFGSVVTFTTEPCTPGAFAGVAAVVGQTGATMLGAVNPNGTLTNAHFEWGATTAYGNITPDQAMGSGLDSVMMGAVPITGLVCNTTYHFRTVAQNSFGSANSPDRAFTTAPCAATPIKGTVYALNGRYPFTNLIYGYGVTNAGALIQLPGFPLLNGVTGDEDTSAPEQLTYDPARKRLYAINGTLGTLSVFNVDTRTGALTPAPFSPIVLDGGVLWTTVHVHPSGSPVVVGGIVGGFDNPAATGQVASYVITPTTATPAAGSPFAASVAYVYSSAFSRDGNYLYAGAGDGVGTNPSTAGYAVNPSNGVLTPLAGSPFTFGGSFPIAYATDTSGRLFSATNEDNQILAFTTSGGIPTAVSGNPFAAPGLNDALSGVVHPAGFYLVAAENSGISVYQIAGSGAATTLTNVAGSPFATGGNSPTSLALSKDGNLLIVNNGESRNLRVFSVSSSTGALTPLSTQPFDTLADQGAVPSITFAPSGSSFGDFNADSRGDLLLRNKATGQNIGWLMNGLTVSLAAFMPTIADTNWKIAGRSDFDGDGKADVILRNSATGQDIGWLMNGLTVTFAAFMPTIADTNWEIKGVGDFNGDGKGDVILRNKATGQNIGWLMNGLTVSLAAFMPTIADTNWEIVGVGDFDGDGKADVILRNRATGQNIGWLMNGLTVATAAFMPTIADTNWEIKGVGDFNGDGKADVVLRNKATGQDIGWLMNGLTVATAAFLPTIADTNWEIKGAGDFDGDGKADVILRNRATGQNIGWLMNGLSVSMAAFMPTIADTNWELVGQGQ